MQNPNYVLKGVISLDNIFLELLRIVEPEPDFSIATYVKGLFGVPKSRRLDIVKTRFDRMCSTACVWDEETH